MHVWVPRCLAAIAFLALVSEAAAQESDTRVVARDTTVETSVATAKVRTVEVHDLKSRGAITRLLIETVDSPAAIVILFTGGKGIAGISESGDVTAENNFVIRSRTLLLRAGFDTAIIDAASDHHDDLTGFRGTAEHAEDVAVAIAHLRAVFQIPVWLVGTSRGTNSVANAAIRLSGRSGPDGIVLTSSMLAPARSGYNLFDYALENISVPVLVAHHEQDECGATPPEKVPALIAGLKGAHPVRSMMVSGGRAKGKACLAMHYHGFNGIEEKVMAEIAAWMKAPSP
jgi:hypothetical protein